MAVVGYIAREAGCSEPPRTHTSTHLITLLKSTAQPTGSIPRKAKSLLLICSSSLALGSAPAPAPTPHPTMACKVRSHACIVLNRRGTYGGSPVV